MSQKSVVEKRIKEIRRNTRRKYSAEEKIRIVLEGLGVAAFSKAFHHEMHCLPDNFRIGQNTSMTQPFRTHEPGVGPGLGNRFTLLPGNRPVIPIVDDQGRYR